MNTRPRDNPFASHRLEKLAFRFADGLSWEVFLERALAVKWRGAVVGPPGTGKTALLEQLAPRLRERGFKPHYLQIRSDTTFAEKNAIPARVRAMRAPDFLLLDGAEQLSTREWLTVYSAAGPLAGCIITVHRTSRLPTLLETKTSPTLLAELAGELGGHLYQDEVATLFQRHHGNLRECLRTLYDRHSEGVAGKAG